MAMMMQKEKKQRIVDEEGKLLANATFQELCCNDLFHVFTYLSIGKISLKCCSQFCFGVYTWAGTYINADVTKRLIYGWKSPVVSSIRFRAPFVEGRGVIDDFRVLNMETNSNYANKSVRILASSSKLITMSTEMGTHITQVATESKYKNYLDLHVDCIINEDFSKSWATIGVNVDEEAISKSRKPYVNPWPRYYRRAANNSRRCQASTRYFRVCFKRILPSKLAYPSLYYPIVPPERVRGEIKIMKCRMNKYVTYTFPKSGTRIEPFQTLCEKNPLHLVFQKDNFVNRGFSFKISFRKGFMPGNYNFVEITEPDVIASIQPQQVLIDVFGTDSADGYNKTILLPSHMKIQEHVINGDCVYDKATDTLRILRLKWRCPIPKGATTGDIYFFVEVNTCIGFSRQFFNRKNSSESWFQHSVDIFLTVCDFEHVQTSTTSAQGIQSRFLNNKGDIVCCNNYNNGVYTEPWPRHAFVIEVDRYEHVSGRQEQMDEPRLVTARCFGWYAKAGFILPKELQETNRIREIFFETLDECSVFVIQMAPVRAVSHGTNTDKIRFIKEVRIIFVINNNEYIIQTNDYIPTSFNVVAITPYHGERDRTISIIKQRKKNHVAIMYARIRSPTMQVDHALKVFGISL
jgi:hypothetical protein